MGIIDWLRTHLSVGGGPADGTPLDEIEPETDPEIEEIEKGRQGHV